MMRVTNSDPYTLLDDPNLYSWGQTSLLVSTLPTTPATISIHAILLVTLHKSNLPIELENPILKSLVITLLASLNLVTTTWFGHTFTVPLLYHLTALHLALTINDGSLKWNFAFLIVQALCYGSTWHGVQCIRVWRGFIIGCRNGQLPHCTGEVSLLPSSLVQERCEEIMVCSYWWIRIASFLYSKRYWLALLLCVITYESPFVHDSFKFPFTFTFSLHDSFPWLTLTHFDSYPDSFRLTLTHFLTLLWLILDSLTLTHINSHQLTLTHSLTPPQLT